VPRTGLVFFPGFDDTDPNHLLRALDETRDMLSRAAVSEGFDRFHNLRGRFGSVSNRLRQLALAVDRLAQDAPVAADPGVIPVSRVPERPAPLTAATAAKVPTVAVPISALPVADPARLRQRDLGTVIARRGGSVGPATESETAAEGETTAAPATAATAAKPKRTAARKTAAEETGSATAADRVDDI
jgi:hypothetical protein